MSLTADQKIEFVKIVIANCDLPEKQIVVDFINDNIDWSEVKIYTPLQDFSQHYLGKNEFEYDRDWLDAFEDKVLEWYDDNSIANN